MKVQWSVVSGQRSAKARRGFSLVEVLLAMFILGIGLIMVASVFPVGADWTRQASEDSVAQTVAMNALGVIESRLSSSLQGLSSSPLASLVPLPGFTGIPIAERCYQYGNSSPFPARHPEACSYYWTALARAQPVPPGQPTSGPGRSFDVYILVFRKGDASQKTTPLDNPAGTNFLAADEVQACRDQTDPPNTPAGYHFQEPAVAKKAYKAGFFTPATNTLISSFPPAGFLGIGETSGTVFRQGVDTINNVGIARPALLTAGENVFCAYPFDGSGADQLIYVYQTTLSY